MWEGPQSCSFLDLCAYQTPETYSNWLCKADAVNVLHGKHLFGLSNNFAPSVPPSQSLYVYCFVSICFVFFLLSGQLLLCVVAAELGRSWGHQLLCCPSKMPWQACNPACKQGPTATHLTQAQSFKTCWNSFPKPPCFTSSAVGTCKQSRGSWLWDPD